MKDLKHALRMLVRAPGFTVAALAALTLGIGPTTAIFSVINTVLLKPLTYPDTDRTIHVHLATPNGPDYGGSPTPFNTLTAQTQTLQM
jgi:putative ABC transport system permease protein